MPLAFITGISTAGKSTVAKELSKLGYEAYDTEYDGMSAWFNKPTNERAAGFNEMPERTEAWLNQREWRIDIGKIAQIQKKEAEYCDYGAVIVDARKPVSGVVNEILLATARY